MSADPEDLNGGTSEAEVGLEDRYLVQKIISRDHEGAIAEVAFIQDRVFVLRPETDEYARAALIRYAQKCRFTHRQLALDINQWIHDIVVAELNQDKEKT